MGNADSVIEEVALQGNSREMKGPVSFLAFLLCLLRTGTASKGWSMHVPSEVTGEIGKKVSLPCTFTHPHQNYDKTLTAIWRVREPYNGTVVFKCVTHSSSNLCKTTVSSGNRYQLVGNPRQNNLSLQIDHLTWDDGNKYFCRVEFSGDVRDKYESRMGLRLHLIASPRIVNISVQSGEDHSFHAKCTAEGEPLPTLTWAGPSLGNITFASSTGYQVTKELHRLTHDGRYTCTAVNILGRAEGAVYFYKYRAGGGSWILVLLFVSLGIKLLALLVILGVGAFWKEGDINVVSNPLLGRQQVRESPYENFSCRINSISQHLQE